MRIILVSPFPVERSALLQLLKDEGHEVSAAATREEALDLASTVRPDAMIADAQIACVNGEGFVREVRECGLRSRMILMCQRASHAFDKSDAIYLTKPIDLGHLRRCLPDVRALDTRVA